MTKINDLTGKVFFRLTVLGDSGRRRAGNVIWRCLCKCGQTTEVAGAGLRQGQVKSCGCLRKHEATRYNKGARKLCGTRAAGDTHLDTLEEFLSS
jgi:hypothetical protein